jgi:4-hydroxymandelate oxidase
MAAGLAGTARAARGVVGRPAVWALACGGAGGVRSLLASLTDDLAHAMALAGAACLADTGGIARIKAAGPVPR